MAISRPFAYNPSRILISGTTQVGDLAVGVDPFLNYSGGVGGVVWWNGADEELGYIICIPVPSGDFPTPIGNIGTVQFFRSTELTDESFLELVKAISFGTVTNIGDISTWLLNNEFWSSWSSSSLPTLFEYTPNYSIGNYDVVFNQSGVTSGISKGIDNPIDNDGERPNPTILIKKENNNLFSFDSINKNQYTVSFWTKINRFPIHSGKNGATSRKKRINLIDLRYGNNDSGYMNNSNTHYGLIDVGVTAPYYLYDNSNDYKYVYEPFNFVCTLSYIHIHPTRPITSMEQDPGKHSAISFYTDFSYNLETWYFVTLSIGGDNFNVSGGTYEIKMYINNEQVSISYDRSNLISNYSRGGYNQRKNGSARKRGSVGTGPNFVNRFGDIISNSLSINYSFNDFILLDNLNCISFSPIKYKSSNLHTEQKRIMEIFRNTGINFGKIYIHDTTGVTNYYNELKNFYGTTININSLFNYVPNSNSTYTYDIVKDPNQHGTTYGIVKGMNYLTDWENTTPTILLKNENSNIYEFDTGYTGDYNISFWVKLKRFPKKDVDAGYVRNKKTYLANFRYSTDNTGYKNNSNNHSTLIDFGAMAPYYIYDNSPTYKFNYSPFSFTCTISNSNSGLENQSAHPSFTIYTDYSYSLNTWYLITLSINSSGHTFGYDGDYSLRMFVNNTQVNIASHDSKIITNAGYKRFYIDPNNPIKTVRKITYIYGSRKKGEVAAGPNFINNTGNTINNYTSINRNFFPHLQNLNCISFSPIKTKTSIYISGTSGSFVSRNSGIDFGKIYIYEDINDINTIYNDDTYYK